MVPAMTGNLVLYSFPFGHEKQSFVSKPPSLSFYEWLCVELDLHLKGKYFPFQKLVKHYLTEKGFIGG